MPVQTIFLIDSRGELVEMTDSPYDSERLLQELLAKHPSVLAGDQMGGGEPVKWLFVERETGIPDQEAGSDRWAVDHVFIDQNGVPTLVEVKRSTDTRIRREVVGQMLDYAANAVLYWPVETIRRKFEYSCQQQSVSPDQTVAEFIGLPGPGSETAVSRFWETVETNLRAGKVRLIFAADEIPPELRRVVEFLNEQMSPAEVLAIEIRQYVGTGVRTLVPSVIGATKRASVADSQQSVQWTRESFLDALRERCGSAAVAIAIAILEWANNHAPILWWGEGRRDGSCFPGFSHHGTRYYPFSLWTYGRIEMQFKWLKHRRVPDDALEAVASGLNAIPGIEIPPDRLTRRPSFDTLVLKDKARLGAFLDVIDALIARITAQDGLHERNGPL
jgi:hypothetical protein